jgi:hypothetical protein
VVHQRISGLPAPTHNGTRSSGEEESTSLTSITRRHLMFSKERMLKDKRLSSGRSTMDSTRDGELSTLTKLPRKDHLDMTVNTDSTSTELSTSDQDSQCGELLKLSPTISDSEDITTEEEDSKLGSSIEFRIPSSLNTPDPTQSTWLATIVILTSD